MLYIIALIFPPISVLIAIKSLTKVLINIMLTFLYFFPGVIHAWVVIGNNSTASKNYKNKKNKTNINDKVEVEKIEPFNQYFPSIETMSRKQRKSYEFICAHLEEGKHIDVEGNISYLFIYMYEKLNLILKNTNKANEVINDYKNLYENYKHIDKVASYLLNWIGDLYCFCGEFKNALEYYELDPSGTQTHLANKVLNIKYHKNVRVRPEDIFCINKILTDYGRENFNKVIEYSEIILEEERKRRGEDYLQYIGDKYYNEVEKSSFNLFNGYPGNYELNKYFHSENEVFEIIPFYKIEEFLSFARELSRDAENLLREEKDIPKVGEGWVSETELYYKIKDYIENFEVVHHYNSDWLGQQHLDIFIPELDLAFEYQGKQHFEPVEFFGGEEAFEEQKKRDKRKKKKCSNNDVKLICVKPDYNFENIKEIINEEVNG
ncbi:YqaE/Pmp3 family membrane protein [Halanaerobacter jeridensis]|uniref:Uncharacterized membrane protein YqaE (UPF0057 family) n=1 Tax=Halanaerobacter jeridensis TaxID=706427 RepID=A0A938XYT4_9FIRM|nr:YqaE/Pmp3 family membrane protein [Halanaerobacter jeridensis]MBM7558197.1 uncharacterized membrane protein YqaE (UPF0057 family) [Halanaerobacter jeridensis]